MFSQGRLPYNLEQSFSASWIRKVCLLANKIARRAKHIFSLINDKVSC